MSSRASACTETFVSALARTEPCARPYRHWRLKSLLPDDVLDALNALDLLPPDWHGADGRRAWNNTRLFVDPDVRRRVPASDALARGMQAPAALRAIEEATGLDLAGFYLRIEYCLDGHGFWLEPHTDLGVKRLTLQAYCARDKGAADWGTSLYDADKRWVENVDASFNNATMFVPADNTWHGFEARQIDGVRRSLIINYVTADWQNRHELAFPDRPVVPRGERCEIAG